MGWTGLYSCVLSQYSDETVSLGGGLPGQKSTARVDSDHDGINGYVCMTKVRLQVGVQVALTWRVYFAKTRGMNDYLSSFQSRYVAVTGQLLNCIATLEHTKSWDHPG